MRNRLRRDVRSRALLISVSVAVLAVMAACTGEIDRDVFDARAATNTAIAGETQVAGVMATATANAERANAQATRFAGG